MLNVEKVFTAKWIPQDSVKDFVGDIIDSIAQEKGITEEQKVAILNALDSGKIAQYEPSSPFIDFQSNNGVVIPDFPSCREIAISAYKQACGEDIDTTTDSHVGRMIEQTARILASGIGFTAANIMQTELNSATGRYLDALGSLFLSERRGSVATTIDVKIKNNGSTSITLEAGKASVKDVAGTTFTIASDVAMSANAEVLTKFIAEEVGAILPDFTNPDAVEWNVGSDDLVCSVMNQNVGYDVESDYDFRARLKKTRTIGFHTQEAIHSALFSITGVYDANLIENTSNTTETIGGVPIPGHSIAVYVDYDGTEMTRKAIANAIFEHKSVGCGYFNNTSTTYGTREEVEVTDEYFSQKYKVYFYKPKAKAVKVLVEVARSGYSGEDLEADVKNAVLSWASGNVPYVDGLKIGQTVKAYEIGAAISDSIRDIQIDGVTIGTGSDTPSAIKVSVESYEIATIAATDITVNII